MVHLTSLKPLKKEKPSTDVAKKTLHESNVGKEVPKPLEPAQEEPRVVDKGVSSSMDIQESHDASSFVAKKGDREEIEQEGKGSEVPYKGENKHEEVSEHHLDHGDDTSTASLKSFLIKSLNAISLDFFSPTQLMFCTLSSTFVR